jgi:hypothetical protein
MLRWPPALASLAAAVIFRGHLTHMGAGHKAECPASQAQPQCVLPLGIHCNQGTVLFRLAGCGNTGRSSVGCSQLEDRLSIILLAGCE